MNQQYGRCDCHECTQSRVHPMERQQLRRGIFESEYLSERSRNLELEKRAGHLIAQLRNAHMALSRIIGTSHSWVILEETAHILTPVHTTYREIARNAVTVIYASGLLDE